MRFCLSIAVLFALATVSTAQDRHNWDSLGQLKTGDRVRVSATARSPITGAFENWSPGQVTVANVSLKKEDVLQVERYRNNGEWSRGKRAALGALIGFGGGFAIGAAAGGNCQHAIGPCPSRGALGAGVGGAGAVIGAAIGAALPHHNKELIYSSR